MSYWVGLIDAKGDYCRVAAHQEGGTFVLGGTTDADLNVTYNYAGVYGPRFGWNLRDLSGKRAGDTVPDLERMVNELGTERDPDYWAKTPGNAGHALSILLGWARQHPDGRWVVS